MTPGGPALPDACSPRVGEHHPKSGAEPRCLAPFPEGVWRLSEVRVGLRVTHEPAVIHPYCQPPSVGRMQPLSLAADAVCASLGVPGCVQHPVCGLRVPRSHPPQGHLLGSGWTKAFMEI